MANTLNENLTGRVVVLSAKRMKPEYQDLKYRLFKVSGGFGAQGYTMGRALFGTFLVDGEEARMDGYDVERLAAQEEIKQLNG
jgi:hypothetical protein